jgi:GlpG protein
MAASEELDFGVSSNLSSSRIMRLIGHLKNEATARRFADYLASLDIRSLIETDAEGWAVWIYSEDQIESGQQALAAYQLNPADAKYQLATQAAAVSERRQRREEQEAAKRIHTSGQIWSQSGRAPLTLGLIGVCVAVALLDGLKPTLRNMHWLWFSENGGGVSGVVEDLRAGQVWRWLTPIFIHFGLMHLFFNMLWLRDLGGQIEMRQGTAKLALMVVVLGVGSNFAQYFWGGPLFGGMSGVVYGLFGYVWMRGRCDPWAGLMLSPGTVWMMLVWFFLCLFDIIPDVANGAHGAGLVLGVLWGAAPKARNLFRSS